MTTVLQTCNVYHVHTQNLDVQMLEHNFIERTNGRITPFIVKCSLINMNHPYWLQPLAYHLPAHSSFSSYFHIILIFLVDSVLQLFSYHLPSTFHHLSHFHPPIIPSSLHISLNPSSLYLSLHPLIASSFHSLLHQ